MYHLRKCNCTHTILTGFPLSVIILITLVNIAIVVVAVIIKIDWNFSMKSCICMSLDSLCSMRRSLSSLSSWLPLLACCHHHHCDHHHHLHHGQVSSRVGAALRPVWLLGFHRADELWAHQGMHQGLLPVWQVPYHARDDDNEDDGDDNYKVSDDQWSCMMIHLLRASLSLTNLTGPFVRDFLVFVVFTIYIS